MTPVAHPPQQGYRTIRFPLAEHEYAHCLSERLYAKVRLQALYEHAPALFPAAFPSGYPLDGFPDTSCTQRLRCRRLRLEQTQEVFPVAPAFVMPYRSGRVDAVEQAVCLMRLHVPCWAMAYVFGRDAMSWDRLQQGLGRLSLVGTTVKTAAH